MSTTMHFGPEWMRTKQSNSARPNPPPSPPPITGGTLPHSSTANNHNAFSLLSTSAANSSSNSGTNTPPLGSHANTSSASNQNPGSQTPEKQSNPPLIRYSKEELLRIYRENGGKAGVGVDAERWDTTQDPASGDATLSSEDEKKRFPDSGIRRRQSTDVLPTSLSHGSDRPRLSQSPSLGPGSPMRDRFGGLVPNRRRESSDQTPTIPRKLPLSTAQGILGGGGQPSPRTTRAPPNSGFDSPLTPGGDSWMARRQALKGSSNRADGGPDSIDRQDSFGGLSSKGDGTGGKNDTKGGTPPPQSAVSASGAGAAQELAAGLSDMSLNNAGGSMTHDSSGTPNAAGLPPGVADPTSVQWSYLDPQGQVQGPFRADIMQKWHDDGYFTQDLLIKRLTIDLDWMTVAELRQRTNSPRLFLTQIPPVTGPPGLARAKDSPHLHFASIADQNMNSPHQPAPLRSLRASALESYVGNGSNPSDSPTSSFGAGRSSTDPSAFGGRAGNPYFQDPQGFGGPADVFGRRNAFGDGFRSGSADLAPGAGQAVDGFGYNARYNGPSNAWPSQNNLMGGGFGSAPGGERFAPDHQGGYSPASGLVGASNGAGMGDMQYSVNNGLGGVDYGSTGNNELGGGMGRFGDQIGGSPFQSYNQYNSPTVPSAFNQYAASHQPHSPYPNAFETPTKVPQANRPIGHDSPLLQNTSPWSHQHQQGPESPAISRPAPYESPLRSAAVAQPSWGQKPSAPAPATAAPEQPQWNLNPDQTTPVPTQGQVWPNSTTAEAIVSSLTVSNVGKHNQQHEQLVTGAIEPPQEIAPAAVGAPVAVTIERTVEVIPSLAGEVVPPVASTTKTRKGSGPQLAVQPPTKPSGTSPITLKAPTPPPPTILPPSLPAKPAWSIEDENKKGKVASSVSLRDIQEAEAKKAEARKVAERERERTARATASSSSATEEAALFTATWGLSGARGSAPKDSPTSSTNAASPAAAWTAAAKAPAPTKKKTMKEIQEEEEKRKAAVKAAAPAAAPPRRGYADSTGKTTPGAPAPGGAWTTVGSGGKSTPVPTRPGATPTPAASTSTTTSVPRVNGAAPRTAAPPVAKVVAASRPVDDTPVAPSHDFLKWLNDSLKGLNNSVNVEEIMSMLLQFPIDADSSTLEIISDLIYANSTTLDGRRFASEFASKRKVDAANRQKTNGAGPGSNKPVSIADVVKAQPKPTTSEWGGFKVVNKKKKGGRA